MDPLLDRPLRPLGRFWGRLAIWSWYFCLFVAGFAYLGPLLLPEWVQPVTATLRALAPAALVAVFAINVLSGRWAPNTLIDADLLSSKRGFWGFLCLGLVVSALNLKVHLLSHQEIITLWLFVPVAFADWFFLKSIHFHATSLEGDLRVMIDNLRGQVVSREAEITRLRGEVAHRNAEITRLRSETTPAVDQEVLAPDDTYVPSPGYEDGLGSLARLGFPHLNADGSQEMLARVRIKVPPLHVGGASGFPVVRIAFAIVVGLIALKVFNVI